MVVKGKKEKFGTGFRKLISDLKPMTWKQRVEHLWMYYKEWLWIAAAVVLVVAAMISSFINMSKDVIINGMMVNIAIEQQGYNYLSEDYFAHIGAQEGKQIVSLEYTNFESLADPTSNEDNYYAAMTVTAEVSAGTLDYIIQDQLGLEFYITQDVYMDLREFFSQEELDRLKAEDRLIYAMEEDSNDPWVVAVDITDIAFVKDNITSEGKIYFSMAGSSKRVEAARDMWEYINAWEAAEQ